jgi:3-deoxy-D-manno-octulosonic-acid transferase
MTADPIERLLRGLYSTVLYVLLPVTVYHLIWRGFRQGAYLERWSERYAAYRDPPHAATVWVHAVSVGEVNAAAPLVDALLSQRPDLRLLVTTITPTGSARVQALWAQRVAHVYLPYDLPGAVGRFLAHFQPCLGLVVETELWPNLLLGCRDRGVPVYLVNARMSERSLRGYRLLRPLIGRAIRSLRRIAAQSEDDAHRFVRLGADQAQVSVLGNLKYDVPVGDSTRAFSAAFRQHCGNRLTWIAASTHEDEEAAVLAIHARLRRRWPDLLLLWAPRHPERFRVVAQQTVHAGWRVATRRLTQWPDGEDAVFVVDTLGELMQFYGCAEVAFVGGSLQPVGGHNLLEPAAMGTAIVTGPHLHNFSDIARQLEAAAALRICADAQALGDEMEALLADAAARGAMVDAGRRLLREGRGALARTLAMVEADLPART